jgi:5-methylcytosine-specific restriction endonuclease McrA
VSARIINGIRICADGREVCETDAAWQQRRREVYRRAKGRCECESCPRHVGRRCNRRMAFDLATARETNAPLMHAHHVKGRGAGGGGRDDRLQNLEGACEFCHRAEHERRSR